MQLRGGPLRSTPLAAVAGRLPEEMEDEWWVPEEDHVHQIEGFGT